MFGGRGGGSLAPWPGMGAHSGHSGKYPAGGKASLVLMDGKIPQLTLSPATANTSSQNACCPEDTAPCEPAAKPAVSSRVLQAKRQVERRAVSPASGIRACG